MMNSRVYRIGFFIVALLALGLYFVMFEFRYMWFVEAEQAMLMRSLFAAVILVLVALWAVYPSVIVVALVATLGLFFPHLVFDADARPLLGRALDLPTLVISAVPIALLAFATYLRKRDRKGQSH